MTDPTKPFAHLHECSECKKPHYTLAVCRTCHDLVLKRLEEMTQHRNRWRRAWSRLNQWNQAVDGWVMSKPTRPPEKLEWEDNDEP